MERVQFFFDESGKSDFGSSKKSEQPHLIIAGVLVPWDSGFWNDVKKAWQRAAQLLCIDPHRFELHGWELYGRKGRWTDAPNALSVLEIIFSALKEHSIPVYWTGLPVELLKTIQDESWKRVLVTYLNLLHQRLSTLGFDNPVEVYGDENSWVKPRKALTMKTWLSFQNKQVCFLSSSEVHGIQVADVVAHTLYRSNKNARSNTDKTADGFRAQIAGQICHLP